MTSLRSAKPVKKIIITGTNGVGKSHFAAELAAIRPGCPVISFDAIKLATGWHQHPRDRIEAELGAALDQPAWILEGGPSLLPVAVAQADALIWLDPPEALRAWRLVLRPWKNFGQTRPELPPGNVDWPLQQYGFALRSLKRGSKLRHRIAQSFDQARDVQRWRCRSRQDGADVLADLALDARI